MDDAHTLLVEANAQVLGIRNMTVDAGDADLHHLNGFELNMMLKPVTERLEQALKLIEEQ